MMTRRKVSPERVRVLRDLLAAGMNPNRAAGIAGVSKSFAYRWLTRLRKHQL